MGEPRDVLDQLLGAVLEIAEPLGAALTDHRSLVALLAELGWTVEAGPVEGAAGGALTEVLERARAALEAYRGGGAEAAAAELVAAVVALAAALADPPPATAAVLPAPLADPAFWVDLGEELPGHLLGRYLLDRQPVLAAVLTLVGVLDTAPAAPAAPEPVARLRDDEVPRAVVRWDRLPALLRDPSAVLGEVHGWGGPLDGVAVLGLLQGVLATVGLRSVLHTPGVTLVGPHYPDPGAVPEELRALRIALVAGTTSENGVTRGYEAGLDVLPVPADDPATAVGLAIAPYADASLEAGAALSETVTVVLTGGAAVAGEVGVRLRPSGVEVFSPQGPTPAGFAVTLAWAPPAPVVLLGGTVGTRLSVAGAASTLETVVDEQGVELRWGAAVDDVRLVLDLGGSDGFLRTLLGPEASGEMRASASVLFSSRTGLRLGGQGGLRVRLPVDRRLGGLHLRALTVGATVGPNGVALGATVDAALRIGPVAGVVEGVGAALSLVPAEDGPVLGLAATPAFTPPTGVGLVVAAGPLVGGGFVSCEPDEGRYTGILQLEFSGIALKAVGLITTLMPDGSDGFSMLLIISAEFSPIQLGYGFTLNGVGGLVGIHRTVALDALRAGVKARALDSIMFPRDPVADAPRIVADLSAIFPVAQDRFVVGPMARLGWGTPTLLTLDLGIVLELPAPVRLAVLGRLRLVLPHEDAAVVSINMDVLGVLDLDRGEVSIDATLYDSRIAGFALSGDMALRVSWGERPAFALAVGGYHPRFAPPPGFPRLDRLALTLARGDNPRLRLECYLALTSNTVQFGARLELYAAAAGFSIEGMLAFDALVGFDPFLVLVDIAGSVALRHGTRVLAAIEVALSLSGPTPWHAVGFARFAVLCFRAEIAFDVQLGGGDPPPLPPPEDVEALVAAALADPRNWTAQRPPEGASVVTVRAIPVPAGTLLVHPLGAIAVSQRIAPLGRELDRLGAAGLQGATRLDLTGLRAGATAMTTTPVQEAFAPAQFLDLTDDEKLARPAFERWDAGLRATTTGVARDAAELVEATAAVRTVVLDAPDAPPRPDRSEPTQPDTATWLAHGPAGRAAVRRQGAARYDGPSLGLDVVG